MCLHWVKSAEGDKDTKYLRKWVGRLTLYLLSELVSTLEKLEQEHLLEEPAQSRGQT